MMPEAAARFERYTTVAIMLHWLIAIIVVGNLIGGLTIDVFLDSPDAGMVAAGRTIIGLHKALGLLVIVLTLVRIGWRLANPPPPSPAAMSPIEKVLALAVQAVFYALLLILPLSGWAMVSTGRVVGPIPFFGLFAVPALPLPAALHGAFGESHTVLGWLMVATITLHVLGAMKHQFLDRDHLIARMLR